MDALYVAMFSLSQIVKRLSERVEFRIIEDEKNEERLEGDDLAIENIAMLPFILTAQSGVEFAFCHGADCHHLPCTHYAKNIKGEDEFCMTSEIRLLRTVLFVSDKMFESDAQQIWCTPRLRVVDDEIVLSCSVVPSRSVIARYIGIGMVVSGSGTGYDACSQCPSEKSPPWWVVFPVLYKSYEKTLKANVNYTLMCVIHLAETQ